MRCIQILVRNLHAQVFHGSLQGNDATFIFMRHFQVTGSWPGLPMHEGLKAQHATFENIWGDTKLYTYLWQAIKCVVLLHH